MNGDPDQWDSASVEDLAKAPDIKSTQALQVVRQTDQQHKLRSRFFWFALGLAASVVIVGSAVIMIYVCSAKENANPIVLTGWFTTSIVEVLGIIYIIAQYLFAGDPRKRRRRKK